MAFVFCHSCFIKFVMTSQRHNRVGDVMVSVLAWSAVDRGFEPQSGQTKNNEIGICCFPAKRGIKDKNWLARNQNNVSAWSDMSTSGLMFQ